MSDTTKDAVPLSDAEIKACALMIKGICMTRPQEEWSANIESRIRFMLSRSPAEVQAEAVREPLYRAAINCPHSIEHTHITLHYDAKQPGHNALDQLARRLEAAAPSTGDQS